ncbi:LPS export ABC transporter permease LptG [Candidatus Curculioniphilus buchneri]|uniref:LPS export ABC transporter permease LptG n=1 Tax=Candidatus Curculioniphilus buchneri TaxID=690594 RepID=UPI00376EA9AF
MLSILDRYVGKHILSSIMVTSFVLILLSGMIKFVEQLRKVDQGSYSVLGASLFTFLSIPKDIEQFFPMIVLLGALLGLSSLTNYSELIIMQTSGLSRFQIAGSVMKTVIPLVFLIMIIGEWIVPISEKLAYTYRTKMTYGTSMFPTQNGLWVKDGNNFVFIEKILSNTKLIGINIYHFDKEERLQFLCYAATANFSNYSWKLSQVNISYLTDINQITTQEILSDEWKTTLTPDRLNLIVLDPNSLSILKLYNYIDYLQQNGQEIKNYQLNMWSKIFLPLSTTVMLLMALSFILGPLRGVSIGVKVVIGIILGFFFHILDKFLEPLSLIYNISPVFGAILPSIVFLIISIIALLKYP